MAPTISLVNIYTVHINVFFLFFVLLINLLSSASHVPGNVTDHYALMSFKADISSDPLQSLASWNESTHFCQWTGITCGKKHQRVIEIDLSSKKLIGPLSPYVGNLSFLRIFLIGNNSFTGEIWPEIGHLSKLRSINFENNLFSGKIPSNISHCSSLETLNLGMNHLVGFVPNEFQSLSKLKELSLHVNNLTGKIPDFVGNLSALESIYLRRNNLEGSIPNSLGGLAALSHFHVALNNLSGMIPPSLFNLSNLGSITLILNEFEGSLPPDMCLNLPRLWWLNIAANRFTGPIPISISNASELVFLDISINGFTGGVPHLNKLQRVEKISVGRNSLGKGDEGDLNFYSSISNNTKLSSLGFEQNNLGGTFPRSFGNLSELTFLATFDNPIYGNIPEDIMELVKLETLGMGGSEFTGGIPSSIGNLRKLMRLSFNDNNLSGEIPSSLGNLTKLINLYLGYNNLEGSIPPSFSKLTDLSSLILSQNKLTGHIPSEIFSLPSLIFIIDLSNNRLEGPLLLEGSLSRNLVEFRVSNNLLTGEIPINFVGYESLSFVHLDGNLFQGGIPPSFSSLRAIEVLDLSHNNLTGRIPEYFENFLFLVTLNLSFNDFEGTLPVGGIFKNASSFFVQGNSKICGGVQVLNLPKCVVEFKQSTTLTVSGRLRYIIPVCIGVPALILMCIAFYLYKRRHDKSASMLDGLVRDTFPQVSYRDLHRATDGFSSENFCGSGKFSSVYKGVLDKDEAVVAVKVLKMQVGGAAKSFKAECNALKRIRHRNLVKILTSCCTIDFQGNDFKALVYAFMENGSLERWLNQDSRSLTLLERLSIVIDVACALDYLHNQTGISMVHCDVKPSNILLDSDFVAHLGDFGLLKLLRESTTSVSSTSHTSSLGIKGTVGYAAPEYGMGSEISTCGDVYSFGILVLEIFSGKRPTDDMFSDGLNLHNFVKMAIPERVVEISDSILLQNVDADVVENPQTEINAFDKVRECLISMFEVGVACSVELPRDRLTISDAIVKLCLTKKNLLESTGNI